MWIKRDKYKQLEEQISTLKELNQTLIAEAQKSTDMIVALNREIKESNLQSMRAEENMQKFASESAELKAENARYKNQNQKLQKETERLRKELSDERQKIAGKISEDQIAKVIDRSKILEEEVKVLKQQVTVFEAEKRKRSEQARKAAMIRHHGNVS